MEKPRFPARGGECAALSAAARKGRPYTQARLGGSDETVNPEIRSVRKASRSARLAPQRPSGRAEREVNRGDLWG
jgi:hypothetical protein